VMFYLAGGQWFHSTRITALHPVRFRHPAGRFDTLPEVAPAEVLVRLTCLLIGITLVLPSSAAFSGAGALAADRAAPVIVDHTCTDLSAVPAGWIEAAKGQLRACYGHTSHGSQPIDGMRPLMDDPANDGIYDFTTEGEVVPDMLSIDDRVPSCDIGWGDGNFDERTRDYLDTDGTDRNLVIWSWCGQVSTGDEAYIDLYLQKMEALEADYPEVTFVYMTGRLDGTGGEGNLHQRIEQIRDYCLANNKILYDFADIESYDPDGSGFLQRYADDACDYAGGNWAAEWCADHAGSPPGVRDLRPLRVAELQSQGPGFLVDAGAVGRLGWAWRDGQSRLHDHTDAWGHRCLHGHRAEPHGATHGYRLYYRYGAHGPDVRSWLAGRGGWHGGV
ncbi:MAG: hypothetical protein ACK2U9_05810, partial [Anaerolineae bacterium]